MRGDNNLLICEITRKMSLESKQNYQWPKEMAIFPEKIFPWLPSRTNIEIDRNYGNEWNIQKVV